MTLVLYATLLSLIHACQAPITNLLVHATLDCEEGVGKDGSPSQAASGTV